MDRVRRVKAAIAIAADSATAGRLVALLRGEGRVAAGVLPAGERRVVVGVLLAGERRVVVGVLPAREALVGDAVRVGAQAEIGRGAVGQEAAVQVAARDADRRAGDDRAHRVLHAEARRVRGE